MSPDARLASIEALARAIRRELGEGIDAFPGLRSPEGADPVNRVFRLAVRVLLGADGEPGVDLAGPVSRALRRLAEHRLAEAGFDPPTIRILVEDEPGAPDDWLAFLILCPRSQVVAVLEPEHGDA